MEKLQLPAYDQCKTKTDEEEQKKCKNEVENALKDAVTKSLGGSNAQLYKIFLENQHWFLIGIGGVVVLIVCFLCSMIAGNASKIKKAMEELRYSRRR